MFCRPLLVLFLLAIVLSVLLRFTISDYPFGIFRLLLFHVITTELSVKLTAEMLVYTETVISIAHNLFGFFFTIEFIKDW